MIGDQLHNGLWKLAIAVIVLSPLALIVFAVANGLTGPIGLHTLGILVTQLPSVAVSMAVGGILLVLLSIDKRLQNREP